MSEHGDSKHEDSEMREIMAQDINLDYQMHRLRRPKQLAMEDLQKVADQESSDEELSEPEDVRDLIVSDSEDLSTDDESDDEETTVDKLEWPSFIDRVVYQFSEEYEVVQQLMNRTDRKVYAAFRREDNLPVVLIVAEDLHRRQKKRGVPREVRLLTRVRGHPNVCEILGWKSITSKIYAVVMKYYVECSVTKGIFGNLFLTSRYMHGLLSGMLHIRNEGVCHRDIARENVMWDPVTMTAVVTDFDTACVSRPGGYFRNVGRTDYDAPEKTDVIAFREGQVEDLRERRRRHRTHREYGPYHDTADVYSAGVILWMLLNDTSSSPSPEKLKAWIKKMRKKKKHREHSELDLLNRLLETNPRHRITLEEALNHPFLHTTDMDEECEHILARVRDLAEVELEVDPSEEADDSSECDSDDLSHTDGNASESGSSESDCSDADDEGDESEPGDEGAESAENGNLDRSFIEIGEPPETCSIKLPTCPQTPANSPVHATIVTVTEPKVDISTLTTSATEEKATEQQVSAAPEPGTALDDVLNCPLPDDDEDCFDEPKD
jgi:serine/threonine protein kinase